MAARCTPCCYPVAEPVAGELDATDVFVSLISQKYSKTNTKEYLAKKKDMKYNEDEVQKSQIPSGLCG